MNNRVIAVSSRHRNRQASKQASHRSQSQPPAPSKRFILGQISSREDSVPTLIGRLREELLNWGLNHQELLGGEESGGLFLFGVRRSIWIRALGWAAEKRQRDRHSVLFLFLFCCFNALKTPHLAISRLSPLVTSRVRLLPLPCQQGH